MFKSVYTVMWCGTYSRNGTVTSQIPAITQKAMLWLSGPVEW